METESPLPRKTRLEQAQKKSREMTLLILLPIVFLIGLVSGWLLRGNSAAPAAGAVAAPTAFKRFDVPIESNDPFIGPADAPITIVEYSDFQCPYCASWYDQVYLRLMKEYEGKIRFVYLDLPLDTIHPEAIPAAIAAQCANEQNAYYPYHDALFSNKYGLNRAAYLQYASELGLDVAAFTTCYDEGRYRDEVLADRRGGFTIGATSTPTFYINGIALVGAQPYEVFKRYIDAELAGEFPE